MRLPVILFATALLATAGHVVKTPAERAIDDANQAIAKKGASAERYAALALAQARRARETANGDFYAKAEEAIAQALKLEPDSFEALKMKAWVLLGKHEFAEALQLAKKLNERVPDDVTVYGLLTDAHVELGNYAEAERTAQWMLNIGRSSIPALLRAAYLRELFGDLEGALELMNTVFGRLPAAETEERAWVLTQAGHILTEQGKLPQAARILGEAMVLMPEYHYALANLARVRTAEGNHAEAARLLRRRVELAPHPENFYDLGAALVRAGQHAEGRKVFAEFETRARAEMNGWDNANRELVMYYADHAKRPKEALRIARMEAERRRDVHTLHAYAWALYRAGNLAEARRTIEKALAVGTQDRQILGHAAQIRKGMGSVNAGLR